MRRVLLAGVAAIAVTGVAHSKPRHTWFMVVYAEGKCDFSAWSPEDTYNSLAVSGPSTGIAVDRISPDDVTKDDKGVVHVHMTGTKTGQSVFWDFFTTIRACEQFISDHGIKPTKADSGDIN
jgi:hypothetical protein